MTAAVNIKDGIAILLGDDIEFQFFQTWSMPWSLLLNEYDWMNLAEPNFT